MWQVANDGRTRWDKHIDGALGVASSIILSTLMLLTVVDVVARYLFSRPVRGAFELTELMLLILIFAGLPLVSRADEHVTMDFIDRLLGPRKRLLWVRAAHALCAATMLLLAWLVWLKAGKIARYGDTTEVLKIAVGPFVYFMAAMIAVTALVHAYKIFAPAAVDGPHAGA